MTLLFLFLISYLGGMALIVYGCMFADPEEPGVGRFCNQTLPRMATTVLRKLLGTALERKLRLFVVDYFMQATALTLVYGSWAVMLTYGYPWIYRTDEVSNVHMVNGLLLLGLCMYVNYRATTSDPGFLTAENWVRFDNYPADNVLFLKNKRCPTTGLPKLPRSKFDRVTRRNVARFDHYCGWIHNAVGEENYRTFLAFVVVHVIMCVYGSIVTWLLFRSEVDRLDLWNATFIESKTGREHKPSLYVLVMYLSFRNLGMAGLGLIMAVMAVVLFFFLGYHLWLVAQNKTTNEDYKWSIVHKWFKSETKRYREYLQKNQQNPSAEPSLSAGTSSSSPLSTNDDNVDIGCTGGGSGDNSNNSNTSETEEAVADPGPIPANKYNLGIVENFKEVLFPRSQRKEAWEKWRQWTLEQKQHQNQTEEESKTSAAATVVSTNGEKEE